MEDREAVLKRLDEVITQNKLLVEQNNRLAAQNSDILSQNRGIQAQICQLSVELRVGKLHQDEQIDQVRRGTWELGRKVFVIADRLGYADLQPQPASVRRTGT